jgi:hypothetical protein
MDDHSPARWSESTIFHLPGSILWGTCLRLVHPKSDKGKLFVETKPNSNKGLRYEQHIE